MEPGARRRAWAGVFGASVIAFALMVGRPVVGGALGLGGGSDYVFLETNGGEPVTWNHCRAIEYQVNPKGAPADWAEIVSAAVAEVEAASGFVFADRGTTTRRELIGSRYDGNEWEPVLIMWSDRYQDRGLDGDTIGLGGGGAIAVGGRMRYVVGKVSLDSTLEGSRAQRLVLQHELGHVLGLGHAEGQGQLMYAGYVGQDGFGRGDLAGLKALHDVPCD